MLQGDFITPTILSRLIKSMPIKSMPIKSGLNGPNKVQIFFFLDFEMEFVITFNGEQSPGKTSQG